MMSPIVVDIEQYPSSIRPYLRGARLYDSSCSAEARVIFADKGPGLFLKIAASGALQRENAMARFFARRALGPRVLEYFSGSDDYLLTEKAIGDDCTHERYTKQPERLCDTLAELLLWLHSQDAPDCPVKNHTELYLSAVRANHEKRHSDVCRLGYDRGLRTEEDAYALILNRAHLLQNDTLLHGDYCFPNVILNDWAFGGFIDLGCGGLGDRHVDLFWGAWTLRFNLKTDRYRNRFFDAYGRDKVDEEMLRLVAACEVFG